MSDYLNFSVTNRDSMKDWIMKRLGWPLVQVEISDDQLDICINDSVEEYTKYVIQEEAYLGLNLDLYNTSGFTLQNNIASVFSLTENSFGSTYGGINTLFSVQNNLFGGQSPFRNNNGGWLEYEMTLQYIDQIKEMTAAEFSFEYNERTKLLTLIPNPTKSNLHGWICIGTRIIRPEDQQMGESWVKRYSLSQAKQIIGTIRSKYDGTQLLGGGNLSQAIMDQGLSEQETLLEELKESYIPANFFVS